LDDEIVETVNGDSGAMMARLIYTSNMSLDGCTEDERGAFDWAPPDDDVFAFITELLDEHRFSNGVIQLRYRLL
jgi:hypothetical protein